MFKLSLAILNYRKSQLPLYLPLLRMDVILEKPKPFRCPYTECGKCFSKSSNLNQHIRIHSGEKPFSCQVCNRSFRQSGNLTKHMKSHENPHLRWNRSTAEKPFKCSKCEKSFTANSSLQNHIRIQHSLDNAVGSSEQNSVGLIQAQKDSQMSVHIDKVSGSSCCDFGGIDNGLSFDGCYQPMHSSYHQSRSSFAQTDVIFLDSSLRKLVTLIEDRCINNPDKEFSAVLAHIGFQEMRLRLKLLPNLISMSAPTSVGSTTGAAPAPAPPIIVPFGASGIHGSVPTGLSTTAPLVAPSSTQPHKTPAASKVSTIQMSKHEISSRVSSRSVDGNPATASQTRKRKESSMAPLKTTAHTSSASTLKSVTTKAINAGTEVSGGSGKGLGLSIEEACAFMDMMQETENEEEKFNLEDFSLGPEVSWGVSVHQQRLDAIAVARAQAAAHYTNSLFHAPGDVKRARL